MSLWVESTLILWLRAEPCVLLWPDVIYVTLHQNVYMCFWGLAWLLMPPTYTLRTCPKKSLALQECKTHRVDGDPATARTELSLVHSLMSESAPRLGLFITTPDGYGSCSGAGDSWRREWERSLSHKVQTLSHRLCLRFRWWLPAKRPHPRYISLWHCNQCSRSRGWGP